MTTWGNMGSGAASITIMPDAAKPMAPPATMAITERRNCNQFLDVMVFKAAMLVNSRSAV